MEESVDTKKEEEKKEPQKREIALKQSGDLDLKSVSDLYAMTKQWLLSGMLPQWYKNPQQVITGRQYSLELGLGGTLSSLKQIAIVNGLPCIFGDLPLTLAMKSGKILHMEEFLFDKDYKKICFENQNLKAEPYGAVCRVKTKVKEVERFFTVDDAKKAKLLPAKENSAWHKYQGIMLKYRARTPALKDTVPEALNGIDVLEYSFNMTPETIDISPEKTNEVSEKTKQLFGGE